MLITAGRHIYKRLSVLPISHGRLLCRVKGLMQQLLLTSNDSSPDSCNTHTLAMLLFDVLCRCCVRHLGHQGV